MELQENKPQESDNSNAPVDITIINTGISRIGQYNPSIKPKLIRIGTEMLEITDNLQLSPKLIGIETTIAFAIKGTLVCDISIEDMRLFSIKLVTNAYRVFNFKIEEDDIFIMAQDLAIELKVKFGMLTGWEAMVAFDMGAKDELGESDFLGIKWFRRWLTRYKNLPERANAYKKQKEHHLILNPPPKPSKHEIEEDLKQSCIKYFNDYKNGVFKTILDAGNVYYNYLNERKLIPFTDERKREIRERARTKLVFDKQAEKLRAKDEIKRRAISNQIIELGDRDNNAVLYAAKRMVLAEFFKYLIERESDLEEIINNGKTD